MIRPAETRDLAAVHALLAARSRAAFGVAELELDHLRAEWEVPSFAVGEDNWVAEEDGELVGYAALDATHELTHTARDPGDGDELLRRAEERGRALGFEAIAVTVVREDAPLHALVERNGFRYERSIWRMWRALDVEQPDPAWPSGISVRTFDLAADGEAVHTLLDDAYAGWDPEHVGRSHDDWTAWMTGQDDYDPALWFLAERDGELVGAALHWREHRGAGWVKDLAVRESEQGRGVGQALLQQAFAEYARRGTTRVGLKVDSTNPTGAQRLYTRLGFVTDRTYEIWTKPL